MKRIWSLLIISFSFLASFAATKAEADVLYEKENYAEAATAYESVLKTQGVAAEVYYNLGNCYYKLDKIPLAVLNYERAFLLDPGDGDIRANLALARGKTIDKVVPPSEMFFVTWWRDLTNCMNMNEWAILGIASFVLMLLGILAYMFVSRLEFARWDSMVLWFCWLWQSLPILPPCRSISARPIATQPLSYLQP